LKNAVAVLPVMSTKGRRHENLSHFWDGMTTKGTHEGRGGQEFVRGGEERSQFGRAKAAPRSRIEAAIVELPPPVSAGLTHWRGRGKYSKKVSTFCFLVAAFQSTIDILSARFGFDSYGRREGAELIGW